MPDDRQIHLNDVEEYIEMLYEDESMRITSTGYILQLCRNPDNLGELVENGEPTKSFPQYVEFVLSPASTGSVLLVHEEAQSMQQFLFIESSSAVPRVKMRIWAFDVSFIGTIIDGCSPLRPPITNF